MTTIFDRLYARLGARYPYLLLILAAASVPVLALPALALVFVYSDASVSEYVHVTLVSMPWMVLLGAAAEWAVARTIYGPMLGWLRDSRGPEGAGEAWHSAVIGLPRAVVFGAAIIMVGALVPEIYGAHVVGLDAAGTVALVVSISAFVYLGAILHYFLWERSLRPVVLDIAANLPPGFAPDAKALSVGDRLLLLIPAMNVLTGVVAAGVSTDSLGASGKMVVGITTALVISATAALMLTMLLRRSLTRPLTDLLGAMASVRGGDLSVQVPVVSADEFGTATHHFNQMVDGLRERARFAQENEELLEEVRASRARIIAASDAERRRVERNIHDGAQQHLVGLALHLQLIRERAVSEPGLQADIDRASAELSEALAELRDLARGLHPQVLSLGGLQPALIQLAERSPLPVEVAATEERFPEMLESTAYFVACEALANVAKYAGASGAEVSAERRNGSLVVSVSDDGVGGADASSGSGLAGLEDRIAALGGRLEVSSPRGRGTRVTAELPLVLDLPEVKG